MRRAHTENAEPISLESCLKAFTHEEELGPDALYQCAKCKKQQLASKRIQLWKLPPVLVDINILSTTISIFFLIFFLSSRWFISSASKKFATSGSNHTKS